MRRWFILILALLLLSTPSNIARAQDGVSFQNLEVDVWPEYDQEMSALVIYRITLAPSVRLPAEITLRIPSQADQPHAVAELSGDTLTNVAGGFQMIGREGDFELVRFTATLPELQFEYYDPEITQVDDRHVFTYRWPGDYAVESMVISIQQPPSAADLKVEPGMGTLSTGSDGLNYFIVQVGKVSAATPFDLQFSYIKNNTDLTNPRTFQQVTPAGPVTTDIPGQTTWQELLPWLLGGLGLILIGGGFFWYTRAGRAPAAPSRPRHRAPAEAEAAGGGAFCHQCGKRAAAGDVFCRSCGTRLKT
jgi:hypothetical protein